MCLHKQGYSSQDTYLRRLSTEEVAVDGCKLQLCFLNLPQVSQEEHGLSARLPHPGYAPYIP